MDIEAGEEEDYDKTLSFYGNAGNKLSSYKDDLNNFSEVKKDFSDVKKTKTFGAVPHAAKLEHRPTATAKKNASSAPLKKTQPAPSALKKSTSRTDFGAGESAPVVSTVTSVGGTAAKVAPVVTAAGMTGFQMVMFVSFVVLTAAAFSYSYFFQLPYYVDTEHPFFKNDLPRIHDLLTNAPVNSSGTFAYCPGFNTTAPNLCTFDGRISAVEGSVTFIEYILNNNFSINTNGTVNTTKVYDPVMMLYQNQINQQFLADITLLQTDLATAKGDISTLQTDVSTAQGDISTLQGQMGTAQSDIVSLQGTESFLLGFVYGLKNMFFNNSISTLFVFDPNFGQSQAALNTFFNSSIGGVVLPNGTISSTAVFDSILSMYQNVLNSMFNSKLAAIAVDSLYLIRVETFGNDTTCAVGDIYPCATLNGALTLLGNLSIANPYFIQIGVGDFLTIPGGTSLPFPCNVDIVGSGDSTLLRLDGQTMNAYSMNASSTCRLVLKDMRITLGSSGTLATVNLSPFFMTMNGIKFVNSLGNSFTVSGNINSSLTLIDVASDANLQYLNLVDIYTFADGLMMGGALRIIRNTISTSTFIHDFQVGNNGLLIDNHVGAGSFFLYLYAGSNPSQQIWIIDTSSGGTTTLQGDTTVGMIRNGGNYGPTVSGAGSFSIVREKSGYGIAYAAAVSAHWTALGFTVPVEVQTAIDNLIYYMNVLNDRVVAVETMGDNYNVYVETTGNDLTCVLNNPNLPCASWKRAQLLIPNITSDQQPWNMYFGSGYFFTDSSTTVGCNINYWGKETTQLYLDGGIIPDAAKMAGAGSGYCINRFFGMFMRVTAPMVWDYSSTGLQIIGFTFTNITWNTYSNPLRISAPNNPLSYINIFQNSFQSVPLTIENFYVGMYYSDFGQSVNINSFYGKNLVYAFNQDYFLSYLNISTYGVVPSAFTLAKMYLCYEEQGNPTLFNFYGNNTLSVLECDSASCGLANVNEASFTGSATAIVRRNTNGNGIALANCVPGNWNGAVCPPHINAAVNQLAARMEAAEARPSPTDISVCTFSSSNGCVFDVPIVGTAHVDIIPYCNINLIQGTQLWANGPQYIGNTSASFYVTVTYNIQYTYGASGFTQIIFDAVLSNYLTFSAYGSPTGKNTAVNGGGATDKETFSWSDVITVAPNDYLALQSSIAPRSILSACTGSLHSISFQKIN